MSQNYSLYQHYALPIENSSGILLRVGYWDIIHKILHYNNMHCTTFSFIQYNKKQFQCTVTDTDTIAGVCVYRITPLHTSVKVVSL